MLRAITFFFIKSKFPIDFNNIILKINCPLLNFILDSLFLKFYFISYFTFQVRVVFCIVQNTTRTRKLYGELGIFYWECTVSSAD